MQQRVNPPEQQLAAVGVTNSSGPGPEPAPPMEALATWLLPATDAAGEQPLTVVDLMVLTLPEKGLMTWVKTSLSVSTVFALLSRPVLPPVLRSIALTSPHLSHASCMYGYIIQVGKAA